MRSMLAAFLALQLGWAAAPSGQTAPADARPPMAEMLPLFAKNNCTDLRDIADQIFCGDSDLNALVPRLRSALEARLSRIVDRRAAIAENVEWIKARDSSCGIFGLRPVHPAAFASVKTCLLKETQDRIAILTDANFDCLAANTTASAIPA